MPANLPSDCSFAGNKDGDAPFSDNKLNDPSPSEPLQQQLLQELHTADIKVNYTLHLLHVIQSYEKAFETFMQQNSNETLLNIVRTLMYCSSFQPSARSFICKHITTMLYSIIEDISTQLSKSLDSLGWGRVAFATGCIDFSENLNETSLERDLANPVTVSDEKPIFLPEIIQKLDLEKAQIKYYLCRILLAQKLEIFTRSLSSGNYNLLKERHIQESTTEIALSELFEINKNNLRHFTLTPTAFSLLLAGDISSNSFIGFQILAKAIIDAFRYHFHGEGSLLNRLDKPEWGFRYLLNQLREHATVLSYIWKSIAGKKNEALLSSCLLPTPSFENWIEYTEQAYLAQFDPVEGFAAHFVVGLHAFIRYRVEKLLRMAILASEQQEKVRHAGTFPLNKLEEFFPLDSISTVAFLNLLQELMLLQKKWSVVHAPSSQHLFECFDENLLVRFWSESEEDTTMIEKNTISDYTSTLASFRMDTDTKEKTVIEFSPPFRSTQPTDTLVKEDSQLAGTFTEKDKNSKTSQILPFWSSKRTNPKAKKADVSPPTPSIGLLDLWIHLDSRMLRQMIANSVAKGELMERQDARLQWDDACVSFPVFSSNLVDWLEASVDRLEFLSKATARKAFSDEVIHLALEQFRERLRFEWNTLEDLIEENIKVAFLFDNCVHLLIYLNTQFRHKALVTESFTALEALKLRMVKAFSVALMDRVERCLHRMQSHVNVFFEEVLTPLKELRKQMCAPSFEDILLFFEKTLQERLVLYLFKTINLFPTEERLHFFIQNGKEIVEALNYLSTSPLEKNQSRLPLFSDCLYFLTLTPERLRQHLPFLCTLFYQEDSKAIFTTFASPWISQTSLMFLSEATFKKIQTAVINFLKNDCGVSLKELTLLDVEKETLRSSFGIAHLSSVGALCLIMKRKDIPVVFHHPTLLSSNPFSVI